MKFLIQHNLMSSDQLEITKKAVKLFPHEFIGIIPFSREITANISLDGQDYIPYGSTLLTTLALELGWKGLHFNLDTFNYEAAVTNRNDMLNAGQILPLKEAIQFMQNQNPATKFFVRPSLDLKHFSGQVIEANEAAKWWTDAMLCDTSGSYKMDENLMIVIDSLREIQAEWRWFVIGGKVIDGAMYRAHNQLIKKHETDQEVIAEAQAKADQWLPDSCCVMDLALVDGKLSVIEFNCLNSSGFYGHNVDKIFESLYNYHMA